MQKSRIIGFFYLYPMDTGHTSYTVEEATRKLEYYCSYQDRCHDEVLQKLKSLRMVPQAIDHIMAHLIEQGFLNEERFACSFARGKWRIKNWGRRRIVRELKLRNISKYNIDKALKEINEEEYTAGFNDFAETQWDRIKETSVQKKKKKLAGLLMRKGYENQIIFEKIEILASNN